MSTNNYGLNQWESTDRIQMEDFNADNAKIDAALKAEQEARMAAVKAEETAREAAVAELAAADATLEATNCWVKLKEVTTTAVNTINITGLNLSSYREVQIVASAVPSHSYGGLHLQVNGKTDSIYIDGSSSASNITLCGRGGSGMMVNAYLTNLLPSAYVGVSSVYYSYNGNTPYGVQGGCISGLSLPQITSLQLFVDAPYTFQAGSQIALYGLKK